MAQLTREGQGEFEIRRVNRARTANPRPLPRLPKTSSSSRKDDRLRLVGHPRGWAKPASCPRYLGPVHLALPRSSLSSPTHALLRASVGVWGGGKRERDSEQRRKPPLLTGPVELAAFGHVEDFAVDGQEDTR